MLSCPLQAGAGPRLGGSDWCHQNRGPSKSPARCRQSHWAVDSPGGTERAASPPPPSRCCCFCIDSWAFARGACCNPRDLLSFPAKSVCHSLRLLQPRSQGRRTKCIVGPTMAASIPDGQCSLTRVTARDTTLALLDIINDLETNHLQEDGHGIYASPMPLKTWDVSSRGLRELRSPRDDFSKDARGNQAQARTKHACHKAARLSQARWHGHEKPN